MQTPRWAGPEGRWCWLLPHHQPIRKNARRSCLLWTTAINLLTSLPKLGHMVLRALACWVAPAWQSNTAILYFTNTLLWDLIQHQCAEKLSFRHQKDAGWNQREISHSAPHRSPDPRHPPSWTGQQESAWLPTKHKLRNAQWVFFFPIPFSIPS